MSKDSTRSIRLDGDVSEIAQKLADDKMLSHTLSKLLRQHYGLNTEIDAIKAQLDRTVNERMVLQEEEKLLAEKIDQLQMEMIDKQTNDLPKLRHKLDGLIKLHSKTRQKWLATHPSNRAGIDKMLKNQGNLIDEVSEQIAKLE
jgi:regulator of replication initiation timing